MNRKATKSLIAGSFLAVLFCMNLGMRFAGAPGDCLVADDVNFASVEGGCKDLTTGRVWSASGAAQLGSYLNFYQAQEYCDTLDEGGYSDWRTPTQEEQQAASANGAKGHINYNPPGGHKNGRARQTNPERAPMRLVSTTERAL